MTGRPWLVRLWRLAILALGMLMISAPLFGQAVPAAKRAGDLQVGGSFNLASPDYGSEKLFGFGVYTTFDWSQHLGVELSFRQLLDPDASRKIYERTYEVGPRYVLHYGRWQPYAKFLVGRSIFQFPSDPRHPNDGPVANLAYTMWGGGFGVDYLLRPSINLRADYEFQRWGSFPPHGLSPRVLSFGVAYYFH